MVVQRSGLASVTVVARSNYNEVNSEKQSSVQMDILTIREGHGMHIKSGKYGQIPGWRPDRCEFAMIREVTEQ